MTQDSLFDPSPACSQEARENARAAYFEGLVAAEYSLLPAGATADEVAARLRAQGYPVDELSIRPRVSELKAQGVLYATGARRKNSKGNNCAVMAHIAFKPMPAGPLIFFPGDGGL
jgi:hypothetical protein